MAVKKRDTAIRVLEERLRGNPQSRAFSRLADLYRQAGELQKAVDICLEGLSEHPDYVTGHLVLGRCYAEMKDFESAVVTFTKVCAADRRNHAAMKALADIFLAQDRGETAGRIYAILHGMEPENAALRQLASKHRSGLSGSILDILGIRGSEIVTKTLMESGIDPYDNTQNMDTIQSGQTGAWDQTIAFPISAPAAAAEPTGGDVADQLDIMFGTQSAPPPPMPTDAPAPTGIDIENQLDSIFGESAPPPVPLQREEPTGADVENQIDAMFGAQPAMSLPAAEPTGADVENQIDAMFGAQPVMSIPAAEEPTGRDIENQLDSIYGLQAPAMDVIGAGGAADAVELTGNDIENQLDAIYGAQGLDVPSMDSMGGALDTAEPTGNDIEDQLDAIYGTQGLEVPAMDVDLSGLTDLSELDDHSILDTGIITIDDAEPTGSDVEERIDAMFDTGPKADTASAPEGRDVEDRINEFFGTANNIMKDSAGDDVVVLGQVGEEHSDADIDSLFDFGAAEAMPAAADESAAVSVDDDPAALFDFGADETMAFDSADIKAMMSEPSAGAADILDVSSIAGITDVAETSEITDITEHMFHTPAQPLEKDTASFRQNVPDPESLDADSPIAFMPNVPSDGAEIVHGEDIETRLSELFSGTITAAAEGSAGGEVIDTIEDIGQEADAELIDELSANGEVLSDSDDILPAELLDEIETGFVQEGLAGDIEPASESVVPDIVSDMTPEITSSAASNFEEAAQIAIPQPDVTLDDSYAADADDVQEKIRQLFKPEEGGTAFPEAAPVGTPPVNIGSESSFDERDAPFDLPDHVLTPTLADIYFQQGQPKLALHIYERLAAKDPQDGRLQAQMQRVKDALLQQGDSAGFDAEPALDAVSPPKPNAARAKKSAPNDDKRPLAGVRIKKSASKGGTKGAKKRKTS